MIRIVAHPEYHSVQVSGKWWSKNWMRVGGRLEEMGAGDWRHSFVGYGSLVRLDFQTEELRTAFIMEYSGEEDSSK